MDSLPPREPGSAPVSARSAHPERAATPRAHGRRLPRVPGGESYYVYLFFALVTLTIAYPVITSWPAGRAAEQLILAAVLVTGTLATYRHRSQIALTSAVLTIMFASGIATEVRGETARWLSLTFLGSIVGFLTLVTWMLARDIFAIRGRVTPALLYGAISVYLLVGIDFATAHFFVEKIAPGSYQCSSQQCKGLPQMSAYVYYSFVTLTTVGYGEILPNTRLAGMLAYVEAIVGQMYVAILVARLVGMQLAQPADD